MDHVRSFAECPACAVSAEYQGGFEWARAIRMRGHAGPAPQGHPAGKGKLAPYQAFFEDLVAQDPDITLFELRDALAAAEGVAVHHSSIAALLSRLGFTYKKIAGGRRAPPSQGKSGAARLACTPHACHAAAAGTVCFH